MSVSGDPRLSRCHFIKIDNEDDTFYTFLKNLDFIDFNSQGLRCKKRLAPASNSNKLNRYQLAYEPAEGQY